jgi:hypothetical protein
MRAHDKFKNPYVHFESTGTWMKAQDKLNDRGKSSGQNKELICVF